MRLTYARKSVTLKRIHYIRCILLLCSVKAAVDDDILIVEIKHNGLSGFRDEAFKGLNIKKSIMYIINNNNNNNNDNNNNNSSSSKVYFRRRRVVFNSRRSRCGIPRSWRSGKVTGHFGVQTLVSETETSGFCEPCDVGLSRSPNLPLNP